MDDLIYKITEEVKETEENFIFTTINPWCENVMQRKISKRDLKRALDFYFDGGTILDKIRAEIQELRGCSCSCSDGIIDEVEDILDKYKWGGIDDEKTK